VNEFVPEVYVERIQRLVLGIEPRDAKRRQRIAHAIEIAIEGPPLTTDMKRALRDSGRNLTDTMRRVPRHSSCRHVLAYERPPKADITLRFIDRYQRFVPRRINVPLVVMTDPADPSELDTIDAPPAVPVGTRPGTLRTRRPQLFPGAAYDLSEQTTGLRGRVVRPDAADPTVLRPARWSRIDAVRNGATVGTAMADHKGEFLLLLDPEAVREGQLVANLTVDVTAHAPLNAPPSPSALDMAVDPLWDLPLETLAAPGTTPDGVADGTTLPPGYNTGSATQSVQFQYGVLRSLGVSPFTIT